MLENLRQCSGSYGATKKGNLPIYTGTIFIIFCEWHSYIKNMRPRQSYCNGNSMCLRISIHKIEHLLRYMRQELTLPIASTEREPITLRRQASITCYMYCAVCIHIGISGLVT